MGFMTVNLTRVIGNALINISLESGQFKDSELRVFESKRNFEDILIGRRYDEAQEIISRISANSSISYSIGALKAVENAFGIEVSDNLNTTRELLLAFEKIRSHANHLYFYSLPDYLNEESSLSAVNKYKKDILRGVSLIDMSSDMIRSIAGREIHPITMIVGGISKNIDLSLKEEAIQKLKIAKEQSIKTFELFSRFEYPFFKRETEQLSLYKENCYTHLDSQARVSDGSIFDIKEYKLHISEVQENNKTSKTALLNNKELIVGPLARMNMNNEFLMPETKRLIKKMRILFPIENPFLTNQLRCLEMLNYIERALEIYSKDLLRPEPMPIISSKAGTGTSAIESPEGIIWQELDFDQKGYITKANIISPTGQNMRNLQETIKAYLPRIISLPRKKLNVEIEKLVRSYNPDFCEATH